MYRKPRRGHQSGILDLDSLMDILSCLVGVMLFMVIYTVLELGSTTFQVEMPIGRDAPPGSRPIMVLATAGTVRMLDSDAPLRELLRDRGTASREEALDFVEQANERAPVDRHFRYTLEYRDRVGAFGDVRGTLDLRISALPGVVGDSVQQLADVSTFANQLGGLSPADVWLDFAVDSASLEVFRRARDLASERGFATGWAPFEMELPLTYALTTSGNRGATPRGAPSKPQR